MSAITDVVAQTEIKPQVEKISGASTKLVKPVIEESVVVKVQRKTSSLRTFILSPRLGPFHSLPGSSLKVRHGGRRAGR